MLLLFYRKSFLYICLWLFPIDHQSPLLFVCTIILSESSSFSFSSFYRPFFSYSYVIFEDAVNVRREMMIFEYRSLLFVMSFKPSIQSMFLSFLFLAETFEINHLTNRYRAEEPFLYLFADYFSDKSSIDQKNLEKQRQCTIEAFIYTIVFFYDVHQCNWINVTYVHHGDIHKYLLNFSI